MYHSMRAYLERQSTAELETILRYCLERKDYRYAILEILDVLEQRDKENPIEYPPNILKIWERFLENCDLDAKLIARLEGRKKTGSP